jgi:hypothetical protein
LIARCRVKCLDANKVGHLEQEEFVMVDTYLLRFTYVIAQILPL